MTKKSILLLVIAAIAATTVTLTSDPRSFEELTVRATISQEASALGAKCPLAQEHIDKADIRLLSICVEHGIVGYDAARRYPLSASKVFAVYGKEEVFRKILDSYGHEVIPVVAFYVENGSRWLQYRQALGDVLEQMLAGKRPKWDPAKITREQIGLFAIDHISARGHEVLAKFEIVDGVAKRKPVASFLLEAKELLVGSIADVERVIVRGERLPSWQEVGLAALDVTIVAGGVGAVSKVARVGGVSEKTKTRLIVGGAYGAVVKVGKVSGWAAPIAIGYVWITNPKLIVSAVGWVAEQLGINRHIAIFTFFLLTFYLVMRLVAWFLWPFIWCGRIVWWGSQRMLNAIAYCSRLSSPVRSIATS